MARPLRIEYEGALYHVTSRSDAPPWDAVVGGLVLGSETFAAECRARVADDVLPDEVPRSHRHLGRPSLSTLFDGIARGVP